MGSPMDFILVGMLIGLLFGFLLGRQTSKDD